MKSGKVIITGGTGSLGQAILQRAKEENWETQFTVISRDEGKQALTRSLFPDVRFVLGDIRDLDKLEIVFRGHATVIHAAAYKRVPSAQVNTEETIKTNILGSVNVAKAAVKTGVKRVIGISTDKASQPINAYGMSKAMMEALFQEANGWTESKTQFNLVRYGNVIGSNGSVIPYFLMQKELGGPITVTDKDMTRFWITLDDAVDLILAAYDSPLAHSGNILVPKAPAMSVLDLAKIIGGKGTEIKEIGIRPGEKIHETLIYSEESLYTEEQENTFLVHPPTSGRLGNLKKGFSYTSDTAPKITKTKMRQMIKDWSDTLD